MSEQTGRDGSRPSREGRSYSVYAFLILCAVVASAVAGWHAGYLTRRSRIALVTWNDDPFWDLVARGAEDSANETHSDLTVIRCKPTVDDQTQHLRELLDAGIDGIAVSPKDPAQETPLLNEIAAKKVLITFDSDAPQSNRLGFVGTDDYGAGQICGEEIRRAIPDGGQVIISVGGISQTNGRDRRQGLIDDLLDRTFKRDRESDPVDGDLKGSKYDVVATVLDDGDPARATSLLVAAIHAHPDVKCIAGLFSYSAQAIVDAVKQAGKSGQIKVVGFDETDATQAGVESGDIYSSVLQSQYRCGYEAARLLYDAINGIGDKSRSFGPHLTALPILVLRQSNIQVLREKKVVHQPGANASL